MLDWIKKGMKEDYQEIVHCICTTMSGNITNSLRNFERSQSVSEKGFS